VSAGPRDAMAAQVRSRGHAAFWGSALRESWLGVKHPTFPLLMRAA